jgi:hypothetical protein
MAEIRFSLEISVMELLRLSGQHAILMTENAAMK